MAAEQEKFNMKFKVILFPIPLQGHLNPMLQLANILHSRGFSISIIHTEFNPPNPTNYPQFDFYPIRDGLKKGGRDDTDQRGRPSTADLFSLLRFLNDSCVVPFKDCLAELLSSNIDEEKKSRVCCLILDAAWYFAEDVADGFKIPRIVLRTNSVCSYLASAAIPGLHERGYLPLKESQSEYSVVPELPPLRFKDIPALQAHDTTVLHDLILRMVSQTKSSSGFIWNSFQELEEPTLTQFQQDFRIPTFPIGPFHKYFPATSSSLLQQDKTSLYWLDKRAPKSVLYVSLGSIAAITEIEFSEIAWGLAKSGVPFLWVIRPGLIRGRGLEWIEPLPKGFDKVVGERGLIVKWAPQQEVLAHEAIGAFWTHCGWNSTLESICEGVPMICQPCFGDQPVNARYVSHVWRVGAHLEGKVEREEIERMVRRMIMEDEGLEMRERIIGLKEKVDNCLREGGSSYQSLDRLVSYIKSL